MTPEAKRELEAVVKWLREHGRQQGNGIVGAAIQRAADAIERGDHMESDT